MRCQTPPQFFAFRTDKKFAGLDQQVVEVQRGNFAFALIIGCRQAVRDIQQGQRRFGGRQSFAGIKGRVLADLVDRLRSSSAAARKAL